MTYLVKTYVYNNSFIIEHQFMIFDMTVTHVPLFSPPTFPLIPLHRKTSLPNLALHSLLRMFVSIFLGISACIPGHLLYLQYPLFSYARL